MSTLEERIAAALSDSITSPDLAALIAETEESIAVADTTAESERVKALDPIASPDPVKARAAMEDAAFTRDRLRTVLPRLHARLKQVKAEEYAARWEAEYEKVKVVRDELAAEMREVYPAAVAQLADLFARIAECDRECSRVDGTAAVGELRRLRRVELAARGVEGLLQPDVYIAEMLRLPFFWRDSGPIYAWPPPEETPARQIALGMLAREEAIQREWAAYYADRDRERQVR
jgi:hypothetical protein